MSHVLIDDCFRPDQRQLRHDEAIALLKARVAPIARVETVALGAAAGRVLAADAVARSPVPAHTNSAVDGYAFNHAHYLGLRETAALPVVGRSAAGHPLAGPAQAGAAVRIFTGAVMPEGTDTVVMQEDTRAGDGDEPAVVIPRGLKSGANVRKAGEDVRAGDRVLSAGHVLRPQDLAALASIGIGEVACHRPLRIAIVSTGDEVVRAGARPLAPGEVYDANAPMLAALAASTGAEVRDLGVLPDEPHGLRRTLKEAAETCDVILTSGGASLGEEDHMSGALEALGSRHFWQILIKPGRPMMLGQIGNTVVVGLPGNPVAVFVCFLMYVWPMLRRLGGAAWPEPVRLPVPAGFAFPKRKTGRREIWRGMLDHEAWTVAKFERDGSGLISSLRAADCLIDIPEDVAEVAPGDIVSVIPLSAYGIARP